MVATNVVEVLHLVNPDDPVLAGEGFLESAEFGSLRGQTDTTNAILGLTGREEAVEVVVGHFVPALEVSIRTKDIKRE